MFELTVWNGVFLRELSIINFKEYNHCCLLNKLKVSKLKALSKQ